MKSNGLSFFLIIFYSTIVFGDKFTEECDLVLKYIPGMGLGVYAGKLFEPDSVVEKMPAIACKPEALKTTELDDYIEGFNETHASITFGNSFIYNHAPIDEGKMLSKFGGYEKEEDIQNEFYQVYYYTNWAIFPGDQIFSYYGDTWFSSRNYTEVSTRKTLNRDILHIDNLHSSKGIIPGCPTMMTKFTKVNANYVLTANVDIPADTIIEVCRVIFIPDRNITDELNYGSLDSLVWRKKYLDDKIPPAENRTVIVLLGRGSFYSSYIDSEFSSEGPNVNYQWWSLRRIGYEDAEAGPGEETVIDHQLQSQTISDELCSMNSDEKQTCVSNESQVECWTRMMVSFTTNRDIREGEVLTIDLTIDSDTNRRYASQEFTKSCF